MNAKFHPATRKFNFDDITDTHFASGPGYVVIHGNAPGVTHFLCEGPA